MIRTFFAIAVAAMALVSVAGVSQAAPIAPLAAGVTVDHGNVTQVQWRRHWRWHHHRHCWRGPSGRWHCRWW